MGVLDVFLVGLSVTKAVLVLVGFGVLELEVVGVLLLVGVVELELPVPTVKV